MTVIRPLALATSLALAALPGSAETISATDPEGVAAAMARAGFAVAPAQASTGAPALLATHPDVRFRVFFLGCTEGTDCQHLLFSAQYEITEGLDLDILDTFMATSAMGGAHISNDETDTTTLRYFMTTVGGVSKQQFAEILFLWREANQLYARTIATTVEGAEDDG